jgi:hypothetical protein
MDATLDAAHPCFLGGLVEAGKLVRGQVLGEVAGVAEREIVSE